MKHQQLWNQIRAIENTIRSIKRIIASKHWVNDPNQSGVKLALKQKQQELKTCINQYKGEIQ